MAARPALTSAAALCRLALFGSFPGLARSLPSLQTSKRLCGAAGFICAVKADVGDKFATDGRGGNAPEIDPKIGNGPHHAIADSRLIWAFNAQGGNVDGFAQPRGAGRILGALAFHRSDEHDALARLFRAAAGNDKFQIGAA